MSNVDIEKIIEEQKKLEEEYLNETYENIAKLQEQIDKEDNADTSLYIELMACYGVLVDKVEIFELPDKYMQMAYNKAMEDVEFKRDIGSAYICLGKYSQLKKQNDKALFYYNKAIESEPNNGDFYVIRGAYYEGIKEHKKSQEDYKKALQLNPDDLALQILCKSNKNGIVDSIESVLIFIGIVASIILSIWSELY